MAQSFDATTLVEWGKLRGNSDVSTVDSTSYTMIEVGLTL